jgi:hypothetical protein
MPDVWNLKSGFLLFNNSGSLSNAARQLSQLSCEGAPIVVFSGRARVIALQLSAHRTWNTPGAVGLGMQGTPRSVRAVGRRKPARAGSRSQTV